jgi:transposase
MRFVGIDIGAERHVGAIVGEDGAVLMAATPFQEDAEGYRQLRAFMGDPTDTVVAMEATGHYWQNLFAYLVAEGFAVALLNPLRTHRFAAEDLARTKTDRIDAVLIARFAAQKRPPATPVTEPVLAELRELVRLRDRLVQEAGDRVRQLHRLMDLGFPEFTRHIPNLNTRLATSVLAQYPNAAAFRQVSRTRLAKLR